MAKPQEHCFGKAGMKPKVAMGRRRRPVPLLQKVSEREEMQEAAEFGERWHRKERLPSLSLRPECQGLSGRWCATAIRLRNKGETKLQLATEA